MKLSEFEKKIKESESVEKLNLILQDYLNGHGIDTFAFTYYSYYPTSLHKLKFDFASPKYKLWHKHFIEEGYDDIDSTLDVVYKTTVPIFWNLQQQLKQARNPREKLMRQDSIKYGIEEGISIPIHGPKEDFAILVIIQMQGQRFLKNATELPYELLTAAYYYYHYLQEKILGNLSSNDGLQLSAKEIQCLTLIAKEYSVKEMAARLHLTERTINYYIQRLNKKLGTKNKYQSILKALSKGIISI